MEVAKFVLTIIGTFLSVLGFSFAVFQFWRKNQEKKFDLFKESIEKMVQKETDSRKEGITNLGNRVTKLEENISQQFGNRLGKIEGKLEGMSGTLNKIQDWFINNPPRTK